LDKNYGYVKYNFELLKKKKKKSERQTPEPKSVKNTPDLKNVFAAKKKKKINQFGKKISL